MHKPLMFDLFCGLGGATEGFLAEGWDCIGIDFERHQYGDHHYPAQLWIQDILTVSGAQLRHADALWASPPCVEYSWMAMPWSRAKQVARAIRGKDEFPANYHGSRTARELNELFDTCFRLQREACESAGRHIPLIVENVRGAIPWVGRSRWNFGSFHLWGDVPALMPPISNRVALKYGIAHHPDGVTNFHPAAERMWRDREQVRLNDHYKSSGMDWSDRSRRGQDFTRVAGKQAMGTKGIPHRTAGRWTNPAEHEGVETVGDWFGSGADCSSGVKQPNISGLRNNGKGDAWFQDGAARHGSKSSSRKFASAMIAKIPLALSKHIARTFYPKDMAA